MKKYVCIQLLFLLALTNGYGQTNIYHPFPDSAAVWNQHEINLNSEAYYQYAVLGDTVIHALKYHKIYRHSENETFADTVINIGNSTFIGGIREDSLKRIYFYNYAAMGCCLEQDSIYLLYDFSIKVGDTIKFSNYQAYPYLVLKSTDSVWVHNQYRKRYKFDEETWIEGIGSTRDLLSTMIGIPTCYCVNEIVCFKYRNTTYYLNPKFYDCYPYLGDGVKELSQLQNMFIFPNPFSSQAVLQCDRMLTNATLKIYNSFGQLVRQEENISGQSITIKRNNLQSGLYFFQLDQNQKTLMTEKFITGFIRIF